MRNEQVAAFAFTPPVVASRLVRQQTSNIQRSADNSQVKLVRNDSALMMAAFAALEAFVSSRKAAGAAASSPSPVGGGFMLQAWLWDGGGGRSSARSPKVQPVTPDVKSVRNTRLLWGLI